MYCLSSFYFLVSLKNYFLSIFYYLWKIIIFIFQKALVLKLVKNWHFRIPNIVFHRLLHNVTRCIFWCWCLCFYLKHWLLLQKYSDYRPPFFQLKQIFSTVYHGKNNLLFDKIMMVSAFYQINRLILFFFKHRTKCSETTVCWKTYRV